MPRTFLPGLVLALVLALPASVPAGDLPATPVGPPEGGRFRIGYLEGGPYPHYAYVLRALVGNLADMGWIEPLGEDFPARTESTEEIWRWLSSGTRSRYLEFPADAFWSSGWDRQRRLENKERVMERLTGARDLSVALALGTWAGQDLANNRHSTPVLVFQTSNAVAAGIVRSARESGLPHLFAHCDPERYKRQVAMFHDLLGFKRLGVAYEDTPEGRAYASVADVEEVAAERGFAVERCHTRTHVPDQEEAVASYEACHQDLARRADAMLLTHSQALTLDTLPRLVKPFNDRRIPTFAQGGAGFVRRGALMSMAQTDFKALGRFFAETLGRCLNGARPGDLNQIFEDNPSMALNIRTAKRIGYIPSLEVLSAAEIIVDAED